jgi:putative ABC transport system permease protein
MNSLLQDLRYGWRTLSRSRGFTVVAVLTLALGIGVNSSIFSLINAVLLRPLPFKDPGNLVVLYERRASSNDANLPISGHEFSAWHEQSDGVVDLALIQGDGFNLTGAGEPLSISAARVSAEFFSVLDLSPMIGRTFLTGEDSAGRNDIVVLNERLWKQRFGSDPDIAGRTVTLSDRTYTVVGVIPNVDFMPDVVMPIDLKNEVQKVGKHSHQVVGRLGPGVSMEKAQAALAQISENLESQMPNANTGHGVKVLPLHDDTVSNVRQALLVLFGAVGFVLLIACANVANLLLARSASRQKEIAIRTALGAQRSRLIRQLLTESCLLAAIGGGLGLLLSLWIVDLLPNINAVQIPRIEQVRVDGKVLAVTLCLTLITGILTGIVPALRTSSQNLIQSMVEGTKTSASARRRRIGSVLVIAEVALALILLTGGALMMKSFVKLLRVDPGFDTRNVLRLDFALPEPRYPQPSSKVHFYQDLMDRIRALPGVESVGATSQTPLSPGDNWGPFKIEGHPAPAPGQESNAAMRSVSADYFKTMRIPLIKGRFFSDADARIALPVMRWFDQQPYPEHYNDPQPSPTIIINATMARMYFADDDPLGKRISIVSSPWLTVVGVVGDVHHTGLSTKPNPEMYFFDQQEPSGTLAVMVRTGVDPLTLAGAVREQVAAIDRDLPISVTTMEKIFSDSVGGQRFNMMLLSVFAGLALVLAVVGVFGVINYSVTQRVQEIGIRIALGAQRRDILRMVLGNGLILALSGVSIGLVGAFALTRLISGFLFEVSPTDPFTFVIVSVVLSLVALLASYVPARRAMKVDPMIALRCE